MRVTATDAAPVVQSFWRLEPGRAPVRGSEQELAAELRDKLSTAVVRQTIGDVPVSSFLSGGLDSSAVVSLMSRAGRPPASVHAIGFSSRDRQLEGGADDVPYARQVAKQMGLRYHETVLEPDVVSLLPKLIWHLDEPIADPAVIPAYLVAESARAESKVLLSGMGADEVFGGYRRQQIESLLRWQAGIPSPMRWALRQLVASSPMGRGTRRQTLVRYAKKLMAVSGVEPARRYIEACMWLDRETRLPLYSNDTRTEVGDSVVDLRHVERLAEVGDRDAVTRMLFLDTLVYLPGHNLNYTDKMSMAASVEVRVPFLDNDLVDFAFNLPAGLKVRGLRGKYILKKALRGIVPDQVIDRRKTGFAAPIRSWLHQDLRQMTCDLLSPDRIVRRGLFDPRAVARLIDDEMRGRADRSYNVWALLSLELWMEHVLDASDAVAA